MTWPAFCSGSRTGPVVAKRVPTDSTPLKKSTMVRRLRRGFFFSVLFFLNEPIVGTPMYVKVSRKFDDLTA